MGLIPGTSPAPIPGTIPEGKGREGIGRERKNLTIHSQLTNARPEPRRWMAASRRAIEAT